MALANIAKVDAVAAAAIAKINGLVFTAAAPGAFLLDTYTGAAAAYSVRRLYSLYTGASMRVRRDTGGGTGDDDEADVAFDSNNELSLDSAISNASAGVTSTTFGEFVAASGYSNPDSLTGTIKAVVPTWYGQESSGGTGSGNDAIEDIAQQAEIYNGTAINLRNGSPVLQPTNTTNYAIASLDLASANTFVYVGFADRDGKDVLGMATSPLYRMSNGSTSACTFGYSPAPVYYHNGVEQSTTPTRDEAYDFMSAQQSLLSSVFGDRAGTNMFIGGQTTYMIEAQELVIWKTDQDTAGNLSDIETDINSDYLIYQPTTAPTSGLLATYTGAAAAYSVRQLANTAVISMRVRRDSDDEERNFGFDTNGDLDSQAISDFCTTANGYVTRWWDQSTNGNHADQATDASQLQIYNGTAVITRNGKPMIETTENVTSFDSVTVSQSAPYTLMGVCYNHNDFNRALAYGNGSGMRAIAATNKAQFQSPGGGTITASATFGDSSIIYTAVANGSSTFVRGLGETTSAETTGTTTDTALTSLQPGATGSGASSMQEMILWDDALSSTDYAAIETNMDTYFSVT